MYSRCNPVFAKVSHLLDDFINQANVHEDFFLCDHDNLKVKICLTFFFLLFWFQSQEVAVLLEKVPLSLKDRYNFMISPVGIRNSTAMSYLLMVHHLISRSLFFLKKKKKISFLLFFNYFIISLQQIILKDFLSNWVFLSMTYCPFLICNNE